MQKPRLFGDALKEKLAENQLSDSYDKIIRFLDKLRIGKKTSRTIPETHLEPMHTGTEILIAELRADILHHVTAVLDQHKDQIPVNMRSKIINNPTDPDAQRLLTVIDQSIPDDVEKIATTTKIILIEILDKLYKEITTSRLPAKPTSPTKPTRPTLRLIKGGDSSDEEDPDVPDDTPPFAS